MNLIARILQLRDAGHTTCTIVDLPGHEAGPSAADHVVQTHGFRGIAADWEEISATDAHAIVATLLHRDLAYGQEIMPLETAADLATQLFDLVSEPHTYFTNGGWSVNPETSVPATLSGFNPISEATLDSGVVCVGDGRALLFWVQDEE